MTAVSKRVDILRGPCHWRLFYSGKRKVICDDCGVEFEVSRYIINRRYCPDCQDMRWVDPFKKQLGLAVVRAKRLADVSGNPRVFKAGEHSQEFLRSLIP